jgi:hypothetical protein
VEFSSPDSKWEVGAEASYLEGKIEQMNYNLVDPGVQVGTAFDFPDQTTEVISALVKATRRVNEHYSWGIAYLFEEWNLDDFQWDVLEPYPANFLEIDDTTRYLFLDSRFEDYEAHVLQFFVRLNW